MIKKLVSFLTSAALMSTLISPVAALADEETTTVFSYETYSVSYEIKSSWDNNQIIEVTLTNTGDEPILNWALEYDAKGEINGIWNSDIYDSNESSYVIKNSGYNYEILPEDSVTFGYTLTGDELDIPESITLCSQREDVDAESYSVSLSVSDDWGNGFNGLITIENLSDIPIEAWRLGFDANFEISSVWNAQLLSSDENCYSICSDITTTPIGAGETKTFGFAASKDATVSPEISNIVLSEVIINADLPDSGSSDDSSDESSESSDDSSSEYVDDSSSTTDDSSDVDSNDENSESDSSDDSSEYEEPVIRPQTYTYSVRNEDCAVDEITVSMETAEDLEGTTTIENIMDKDIMCSGVVGLFGEPFDIETSAEFSSAVLTFKVDKSMLGDTEFDNLMFLWYDEENQHFVELETEHDEENSTVSTTVTHFSKYMIVDALIWVNNWESIYTRLLADGAIPQDNVSDRPTVAFAIPAHKSSVTTDPVTVNDDGSISCRRIDAFRSLYDSISPGQRYSIYKMFCPYTGCEPYSLTNYLDLITNNKINDYLHNLDYDAWQGIPYIFLEGALYDIMTNYSKTDADIAIVFITELYMYTQQVLVEDFTKYHTKFYFLDMREGIDPLLTEEAPAYTNESIDPLLIQFAEASGGEYLKYNEESIEYLKEIIRGNKPVCPADTDGDKLLDVYEINGIPLANGQLINGCDFQEADTDGDDLPDGVEVVPELEYCPIELELMGATVFTKGYYFKTNSDPTLEDTDYDGINDSMDIDATSTKFSAVLNKSHSVDGNVLDDTVTTDVNYSFCLKDFFKNNIKYNSDLSTFSLLLSAVIYKGSYICDNGAYTGKNAFEMLQYHGFKDVKTYKLEKGSDEFSIDRYMGDLNNEDDLDDLDHHISEICIGHQEVTYNDQTKDIVAVIVRGTNGTITEWTSNMDIGSTDERDMYLEYKETGSTSDFDYTLKYFYNNNFNEFQAFEDWKTEDNHKGFDITTNRILRYVKAYTDKYVNKSCVTYWITGHSRGGAIANLLSAYLIDEGQEVYAYTFAAPNTTTNNEYLTRKYDSIFNIVNGDDFVPMLPAEDWGFNRYGRTFDSIKVSDYIDDWEDMMSDNVVGYLGNSEDYSEYNYDSSLNNTIEKIADLVNDRNECYTKRNTRYNSLYPDVPDNALPYIEFHDVFNSYTELFPVYSIGEPPIFYFQLLAAIMSETDGATWDFANEITNINYTIVTESLIAAQRNNQLEYPHFLQSYYLLSKII